MSKVISQFTLLLVFPFCLSFDLRFPYSVQGRASQLLGDLGSCDALDTTLTAQINSFEAAIKELEGILESAIGDTFSSIQDVQQAVAIATQNFRFRSNLN